MQMRLFVRVSLCVVLLVVGASKGANAQGFVNPSLNFHFGGTDACPTLLQCDTARLGFGVSIGALGGLLGFEEDIAFGKNFFGTEPLVDSTVITLMSNLIVGPRLGPVRPYAVGGIGLIRIAADTTLANVSVADSNEVGFDLGGGLMILFGSRVGVRADVRGYRSFQDVNVFGVPVAGSKLQLGRVSGGVLFTF
jgi:opacity protein-like surface antigen